MVGGRRRERRGSRLVSVEEYARTVAPKVALHYKEIFQFGLLYARALLRRPSSKQRPRPTDLLPANADETAQDIAAEAFKKLLSGERQDWDGNPETLRQAVGKCIKTILSARLKRDDNLYTTYIQDAQLDWFYGEAQRDDPYLEPLEEHANRHAKARVIRHLLPTEGYREEAEVLRSMIVNRAVNIDVIAELTGMSAEQVSRAFVRLAAYMQTDEFAGRLSEVFVEFTPIPVSQEIQQLAISLEKSLVASDRVARAFGLSTEQLAETVGLKREAFREKRRLAAKTARRVKEMLEIIARVSGWAGGKDQAMIWYRAQPIPAFGGRTAESLVKSGQASALRDYLDHISMGGFA